MMILSPARRPLSRIGTFVRPMPVVLSTSPSTSPAPITFVSPLSTVADASVQAHRLLTEAEVGGRQRKGKVDKSAAAILLQSYLDSRSE